MRATANFSTNEKPSVEVCSDRALLSEGAWDHEMRITKPPWMSCELKEQIIKITLYIYEAMFC